MFENDYPPAWLLVEITMNVWPEAAQVINEKSNNCKKLFETLKKFQEKTNNSRTNMRRERKKEEYERNGVKPFKKVNANFVVKCNFCEGEHANIYYKSEIEIEKHKKIIMEKKLCQNCLKPNHKIKDCYLKGKIKCSKCQQNHPRMLHGVFWHRNESSNREVALFTNQKLIIMNLK